MSKVGPAIARRIRYIPFVHKLNEVSAISKLYNSLVRKRSLQEVEFSTPAGPLRLQLPADESFLSQKSTNNGGHEPFLAEDLSRVLDGGSTFLDVGAHMGYFSKFAQDVGVPAENIHAFEPDEFNYFVLKQNCPGINHHNKFVSGTVSSDEITLDAYVDSRFSPDVVKIDAEGLELAVLDEFTQTIEACHPRLYIEVHPGRLTDFEGTPKEVYDTLHRSGYTVDVCPFAREEYPRDDDVWLSLDEHEPPSDRIHGIRAVRR